MTKKLIPLLFIFVACMACNKDLDTYEGDSGIYFDTKEMFLDTLTVHWGLKNSEVTEQKIELRVRLFGKTVDYDRKFQIDVISENDEFEAMEGTDYLSFPTEYVIQAGEADAYITIDLKRRDDLEVQPRRFTVQLIETPELRFLYTREQAVRSSEGKSIGTRPLDYQRVIYMDESFPMPGWWWLYGEEIFGVWSHRKAALICDVMDIDREEWMKSDGTGLAEGYLKYVGKYMHRWLQENPQTEANGEPMEMGQASQV